jgi:Aerotolerance regulator N-terminal
MSFEYPGFLWASLLLVIPIVIHLFHFRRYKKVIFPHVRFLQNIKKETQSVKKLRNLLVLLARLCALLFLIFAFAQPFKPVGDVKISNSDDIVTLYLDNSFSMEAKGKEGPLFEEVKNKSREIIRAFDNNTRYLILDNTGRGGMRPINRDDAINKIDEMVITHVPQNLNETIKMARNSLEKNAAGIKRIFLLSDFQKENKDQEPLSFLDSTYQITAVSVQPNASRNISIDSAWLEDPQLQLNEAFTLKVKLTNRGSSEITEFTVALDVDGVRKSAAGFDLGPGESIELEMGVTLAKTGWLKGELFIEDEDLSFDNRYFLTFNIKESIRVLAVHGTSANQFIDKLFGKDPYFSLTNFNQGNLDISALRSCDLLIINEMEVIGSGIIESIRNFVTDGGTALIIPKADQNVPYLDELSSQLGLPSFGNITQIPLPIARIDLSNPLFSKVFEKLHINANLPQVDKHYQLENTSSSQALMTLRNEDVFLSGTDMGNGHAYLVCVPLDDDWSTFQRHAIFVPIMLKMALSRTSDFPLSQTISRTNIFRSAIESGQVQGDVLLRNEELEWMPALNQLGLVSFIDAGDAQIPAGNFEVRLRDSLVQNVSYNFHRRESISGRYDGSELAEIFIGADFSMSDASSEELGKSIHEQRFGKRFWKLCVILSLIFLVIEILLLRLWPNRQV